MPEEAYRNTGYMATPNWWITDEAFLYGLENTLLLVFDGHTSHAS